MTVGGQPATDVWVGSGSFLKATAPARPAGTLNDVAVTNPGGGAATLPGAYMSDFLDVPRAHVFHRFVERVFRRGVTGGCGGGNYCPDAAVTREQMAVFLLRAREGPTYVPPACLTPTFADVPCGSRGITGGCSPTAYCPLQAATRGQMSVFLSVTFGL